MIGALFPCVLSNNPSIGGTNYQARCLRAGLALGRRSQPQLNI